MADKGSKMGGLLQGMFSGMRNRRNTPIDPIPEELSFSEQNPGYRGHPGYQEGQYGPEGRWMDADEHRRMNPADYELQGWANLQKQDYLQSVLGDGAPTDDYFDIYEGDSALAKKWREENPSQLEEWRSRNPLAEASLGRFGDNMMRNVDGEPAHVNEQEANLLDNYGNLGQSMVKKMGSGRTNPNTGNKEYSPLLAAGLIGGAIQAGAGLYGQHQMNKASDSALARQQEGFADIEASRGRISDYSQMGQEFMDPRSEQNRMYLQNIQQQGLNQVALQNQLAQRNAAAYGGGFSGATAMQGQQAALQTAQQNRQQWLGMMGQQQQTGLGMINAANQQQMLADKSAMGLRDTMSELEMARAAGQAQLVSGAASGFTSGLLGAVPTQS